MTKDTQANIALAMTVAGLALAYFISKPLGLLIGGIGVAWAIYAYATGEHE